MTRPTNLVGNRMSDACLACVLASVVPVGVASAAWDANSDIRMGIEANDNPRLGQREIGQPQTLLEQQDHTATRALMDARFPVTNFGPRGRVYLQPRFVVDTYSDQADKDLERQDAFLYGQARYRWERAEIGTTGNFSRERIISTEILDTGLTDLTDNGTVIGQPIDTGTGQLVLLSGHRNWAYVAPYANFSISPRSRIGFDIGYLDVSYSRASLVGRSDYSQATFGTTISRTIDDRTGASARVFASDFTATVTDNDTHTVGVEGSIQRKISEIWSFSLTTGVERSAFTFTQTSGTVVDNAAANVTLDLGFKKRADLATLTVDLEQRADPNSSGYLTRNTQLRVIYKRQMSPRLTGGFAVRAFQTRTLASSEQAPTRTFARAGFNLQWAVSRTWSLNLGYDAVSQDFVNEQRKDGTANVLSLGIAYRGLSRPTQ